VVEHRYDFERKFTGFDIVKKTENPYLKHNSQSDFFNIDLIGIRRRGEWKKVCSRLSPLLLWWQKHDQGAL